MPTRTFGVKEVQLVNCFRKVVDRQGVPLLIQKPVPCKSRYWAIHITCQWSRHDDIEERKGAQLEPFGFGTDVTPSLLVSESNESEWLEDIAASNTKHAQLQI